MRWTIRGIDEDVIELVREIAEDNQMTFGECVSEAIETWYEGLADADDEGDRSEQFLITGR